MTLLKVDDTVNVCHRNEDGSVARTQGRINKVEDGKYHCVGASFDLWLDADSSGPWWIEDIPTKPKLSVVWRSEIQIERIRSSTPAFAYFFTIKLDDGSRRHLSGYTTSQESALAEATKRTEKMAKFYEEGM